MSRMLQIYNPVHNQKVDRQRLNVMGRVLDKKVRDITVYLDRALLRRVRLGANGAFECRLDLTRVAAGPHEIEVRIMTNNRTERVMVPFIRIVSAEAETVDVPPENHSADEGSWDETL